MEKILNCHLVIRKIYVLQLKQMVYMKNEDMTNNKDLYDFSEYPNTHVLYDETNKKRVGAVESKSKNEG